MSNKLPQQLSLPWGGNVCVFSIPESNEYYFGIVHLANIAHMENNELIKHIKLYEQYGMSLYLSQVITQVNDNKTDCIRYTTKFIICNYNPIRDGQHTIKVDCNKDELLQKVLFPWGTEIDNFQTWEDLYEYEYYIYKQQRFTYKTWCSDKLADLILDNYNSELHGTQYSRLSKEENIPEIEYIEVDKDNQLLIIYFYDNTKILFDFDNFIQFVNYRSLFSENMEYLLNLRK